MSRRSALAGALTSLVLLGGCAVGSEQVDSDQGTETASLHARPDLARKAELTADEQGTPESEAARRGWRAHRGGATADRPRRTGQAAGTTPAPDTPPNRTAASGQPEGGSGTPLAATIDQRGDHGTGPAHADLTSVDLAERQDALSMRVTVASPVPGALDRGEVEGIGVDLFRSSRQESDYQVFLDGGESGWRAFLQTPEGFVRFPGYFFVDGQTFYVTVPWESVGGRREADVSVFLDWSSGAGRVANDQSERLTLRPR